MPLRVELMRRPLKTLRVVGKLQKFGRRGGEVKVGGGEGTGMLGLGDCLTGGGGLGIGLGGGGGGDGGGGGGLMRMNFHNIPCVALVDGRSLIPLLAPSQRLAFAGAAGPRRETPLVPQVARAAAFRR